MHRMFHHKPSKPAGPVSGTIRSVRMRVASVTLNLAPPVAPGVVDHRVLSFSPAPLDMDTRVVVAADAASVRDLRWMPDAVVVGTLVDVSYGGTASDPANFSFVCVLPEVVPTPEAPTVAFIVAEEVPDEVKEEAPVEVAAVVEVSEVAEIAPDGAPVLAEAIGAAVDAATVEEIKGDGVEV